MAKRKMSQAHKDALAKGRTQAKAVRDYLDALEKGRKPGRKVDAKTIEERIGKVQAQVDGEANPSKRVDLIQKRLDYEGQLVDMAEEADLQALEKRFVKAAKEYSERKGITYTAWREAGVPASALRDAGIPRTRRTA